ncbi:MAG: amidohydrolase family protein [Pirellulales bacterium]
MQFQARRYDTRKVISIHVDDGRIARVQTQGAAHADALPWVAPGFVDIQVNGYGGQEFSSPELTPDKVAAIVRRHWAFGVTSLCPTLTTHSHDCLVRALEAIDFACQSFPEVARAVPGIHLEGPYFSSEDGPRGAHPAEHCRRPSWTEFERLQAAASGRIRILTMSPEFDEAPEFIARATAANVIVAIGHTAATSRQIQDAVDAGARLSTHLGNGAHRLLPRHPNYIWDQLAEDRLQASLIVDGHHLPAEVVKAMVRAKTPERCILVSDMSGLAGLPPGRYTGSGCQVDILDDGRLVIAGQQQLLAGASRPIGDGVANLIDFARIDLATAVAMATDHPARLLGLPSRGLRPGEPADLVLFDLVSEPRTRLEIRATLSAGDLVYGDLEAGRQKAAGIGDA